MQCECKFDTFAQRQKHIIRRHVAKREYACNQCERKFKSAPEVRSHIRHKHCVDKMFACTKCMKSFATDQIRRAHTRNTHPSVVNLYECDQCKHTFKQKYGLIQHQRTQHLLEKPFKCGVCEKAFATRGVCQKHELRVHARKKGHFDIVLNSVFMNKC
jgi:uncharacterized Zn-finger protein